MISKMEDMYPIMKEALDNGQTFTFPVNGSSMQPLLHKNDTVTLDKSNAYRKGDIVFYVRDDGHFVLHRIRKVRKDCFLIVGDHQTRLERVREDQIVGKVIEIYRKGHKKNLNSLGYKFYKFKVKFKLVRWFYSHFR